MAINISTSNGCSGGAGFIRLNTATATVSGDWTFHVVS